MLIDGKLLIAKGDNPVYLLPQMANRHGLIAGATGTGKTITLKTLAQSLSDMGVPSFLADVKGDVSGIAIAGQPSDKLTERLAALGIDNFSYHACPVRFWDVYGKKGHPVRTTISEMGPTLLSRLLALTDVQAGVLNIAFHVADDQGLLLLDLKDLRTMIAYLGEHANEYTNAYGNVSTASIGAIQRSLLTLEDAGGDVFFGEPALDINDWICCDADGKGMVNVLNCVELVASPLLYSTFLLWMLTDLYETLPEVGDLDKPKICFFFDEAHLLFTDAPKTLVDKIEQVVKLIRSKGVGVYFITQNPADIPDGVLAQLGNRVQHALRAYTPAEQKAIHAAAESFRPNPAFDTEEAITQLATGEALISMLDEKGTPTVVERAMVIAPECSFDAAPDADIANIVNDSPLASKYTNPIDRESAYELLAQKASAAAADQQAAQDAIEAAKQQKAAEAEAAKQEKAEAAAAAKQEREDERARKEAEREAAAEEKARAASARKVASTGEKMAQAVLTSASHSIGTGIARGLLNVIKKSL